MTSNNNNNNNNRMNDYEIIYSDLNNVLYFTVVIRIEEETRQALFRAEKAVFFSIKTPKRGQIG